MSLPEVLLVLREDHRRETTRALVALQTEALAAFAVWDREAGRRLEQFRRALETSPNTTEIPNDKLSSTFCSWGVSLL